MGLVYNPFVSTEEKIKLITRNLEEVLTEQELKSLVESGKPLKHYIGLEISGKIHLGTGLANMLKIKDLQQAGVQTMVFLADWHTWLNKKLDGTLETARRLARQYFEEGMKAAALCVGADPDKINFILGSEFYEKHGQEYWVTVIKVSKATTVARMLRSTTIMGRKESEVSDAAMLIYPAMQAADIFIMGINIAQAGTDQRNVHVIARDVAVEVGFQKPVEIHHHLLLGLSKLLDDEFLSKWKQAEKNVVNQAGPGFGAIPLSEEDKSILIQGMKMSKSKPDSAVFIHDSAEEIIRKVNNPYCPEGQIELNPILDWTKHLIFYENDATLTIQREEKFGGDVTYNSYEDLEKEYVEKKLHPQDLKMAVAEWLIKKLEPARKYFEDPKRQEALKEIETLTTKNFSG